MTPKDNDNKTENTNEEKKEETLEEKITNPQVEKRKNSIVKFVENSAHPFICLFTLLFKITSIISFLIGFGSIKASVKYLMTVIFGAIDFWITKNLSGRYLVGLRWWNEMNEKRESVWIFESKNEKKETNSDTIIFWVSIYVYPLIWLIISFFKILNLFSGEFVVSIINLVFAMTNLYGYFKCSKEQQNKIKSFGGKLALNALKKGAEQTLENNK
jgi:hypothetical protein